jgi:DNA-binding transcriptional ArsR family regulator
MADESKLRDYFFEENISVFDKTIKYLKENGIVKINGKRDGRIRLDYMNDYWNQDKEVLNDEYKPELLAAYEFAKKQFEKRLNTYLKRYGVGKLHTWTYWADR